MTCAERVDRVLLPNAVVKHIDASGHMLTLVTLDGGEKLAHNVEVFEIHDDNLL